jgi:hypothetical protein
MLKHYSHIRMEAKRKALESILVKADMPSKPDPTAVAPSETPASSARLKLSRAS